MAILLVLQKSEESIYAAFKNRKEMGVHALDTREWPLGLFRVHI